MHKNTLTKYSAFTTTSERQTAAFTTASERQNGSSFPFFLSAAGAKPSTADNEDGFTLIELLVVIAIIGILAAVVLAALGGARSGAKEASILSSLNSARTQAELYHLSNGSYSDLCSDEKIQEIVASASSTGDGAVCWEATNPQGPTVSMPGQTLAMMDYGIGVRLGDTYYAGSPQGSGAFNNENTGEVNWISSKDICSNTGDRLPTPSELRAIWHIANDTPEGFPTSDAHWTMLESPTNPSEAYRVYMLNGGIHFFPKTATYHTSCID